ncbi:MAG: sensor histidine kinase [Candidatus Cyclobacteriaceae bacterium M3_2C_046]
MFSIKYRYLFIVLLAIYSYVNILFTEGHRLLDLPLRPIYLFGILFLIVFLVWEGNRFIELRLLRSGKRWPKVHPLIIQFLLSLINVAVVSTIPLLVLLNFFQLNPVNSLIYYKLSLGFGFRVNLFLNSVNAIVYFMNEYKKKQLEAEELKKINIEAQFEALRNQINPHFLFNSLNVLSNLVYKDPDTSAEFIMQLSKVYRYLLYGQEKKIVTLKEELEFIDAYIYLLSIRFKHNLVITNRIPDDFKNHYIVPAALQMLIENAIKHNVVSKKNPLKISLSTNGEFIYVVNNLQLKSKKEPSTRIGLKNISKRFEFISDKQVEVVQDEHNFKVILPLIKLSEI